MNEIEQQIKSRQAEIRLWSKGFRSRVAQYNKINLWYCIVLPQYLKQ